MKDENKLKLIGAISRIVYDLYRKNTINSNNQPYFEFLEACGNEIRITLEEHPDFKNVYQGSDIVKTFEELYNVLKENFIEN